MSDDNNRLFDFFAREKTGIVILHSKSFISISQIQIQMSPEEEHIQKMLDAIKRVGDEVLKSKEASRQFLIDAGIIKDNKKATHKKNTR
jgi:hypothetical protein